LALPRSPNAKRQLLILTNFPLREAPQIFSRTSLTCPPRPCYTQAVSRRGWTHFTTGWIHAAHYLFASRFALPCLAQDASTGAIHGTVADPTSRRVAGAIVALVNDATGFHYEQTTDSLGRFSFELLPPGEYSARVTADGMSPQISENLHVNLGGATEIAFRLSLAGAHESVTVAAEPGAVETQPRGLSAIVDERAILNLPLNGRRFTDLYLLTSGVTQDPRGLNSTSNGDLSFGGVRGFQTSYLVDGADNNNGFFSQARGRYRAPYQFSNEVIQEFRVAPNSVFAESGRTAGGGGQRGHKIRLEQISRNRILLFARQLLRCPRSSAKHQAQQPAAPVRLYRRRTDSPQPRIFLRRIRPAHFS